MAIPPKLEGSGGLLALAPLFPYRVYPNDAAAISAVLATLIAGGEPPRIDVGRGHSEWLDRPPYPNGRLLIRGSTRSGAGGTPPSAFVVWYCCARYGRAIPVAEWAYSVGEGTPVLYNASYDQFSCLGNPPYNLNSMGDGWRQAYDDAYAALT
jgi:hypothetical protein